MNLYFKHRDNKLLFAPWGFLMMLGACWVVQVPSSANRQRLYRMVGWFNIAVIAVLVLVNSVMAGLALLKRTCTSIKPEGELE